MITLTQSETLQVMEALAFAVGFIDGTDRTACVQVKAALILIDNKISEALAV